MSKTTFQSCLFFIFTPPHCFAFNYLNLSQLASFSLCFCFLFFFSFSLLPCFPSLFLCLPFSHLQLRSLSSPPFSFSLRHIIHPHLFFLDRTFISFHFCTDTPLTLTLAHTHTHTHISIHTHPSKTTTLLLGTYPHTPTLTPLSPQTSNPNLIQPATILPSLTWEIRPRPPRPRPVSPTPHPANLINKEQQQQPHLPQQTQ